MIAPEKFYYSWQFIVWRYLALIGLVVLVEWDPFPTTYLEYLKHYPGRLVVHACALWLSGVALWLLPTFVRALMRIPAVDFDGQRLMVRGWEDRSFDLRSGQRIVVEVDDEGAIASVSSEGVKPAHVNLKHIDGPRSLVLFLRSLDQGQN